MARGESGEWPAPAFLTEVGHHDDESGAAGHAARLDQRAGERVGDDALAAVLGVARDALGKRSLDHDLRVAAAARRQQPPLRRAGA